MCESNAYLRDGKKEVLIMKDVSRVDVEWERIILVDVMGNRKEVKGVLLQVDFDEHRFYIERRE
ncbi:MAG: CooT family nickel-binding protein [Planctomycetota bacterium]|nr:CooT family nickel-binding protein [Planctomycetota bacterium]